jgi:hypothetical protein
VVLWPVIPLPNPWIKGLDFGVFGVLGLEVFLAGFIWFLLIWQVLVGLNLAMDSSWGVPIIPKVLFKSVEWFGRSKFGFGGVDPRVLSRAAQATPVWPVLLTGLTGASHLWFASGVLLDSCVFGSWCCWSVLGLFGVVLLGFVYGFSFRAGCVLGAFLFQGLEKSLRLSRTLVVWLL